MEIVEKIKNKGRQIKSFVEENKSDLIAAGIVTVPFVATVVAGVIYAANYEVQVNDVVQYLPGKGWIIMDDDNWCWPIKHGLSDAEFKELKQLMTDENISLVDALNRMDLMRFG